MRTRTWVGWGAAACLGAVALVACSSGSSPAPATEGNDSGTTVDSGMVVVDSGSEADAIAKVEAAAEAQAEAGNPLDYLDKPLRDQVTALEDGTITSAGL